MTHTAQGASAPAVFSFEAHPVRTISRDGEAWFVLNDVTEALEFTRGRNAARMLDDDEKGAHIVSTPGGDQELIVINESGLYSLILKSRKPEAKRFKKWVTAEVLPAIRKTGGYQAPGSTRAAVLALDLQPMTADTREAILAQLAHAMAPMLRRWQAVLQQNALAMAMVGFDANRLDEMSEGDARRLLGQLCARRDMNFAVAVYEDALNSEWMEAHGGPRKALAQLAASNPLPGRYLVDVGTDGMHAIDARGCTLVEAETMARYRREMEDVARANSLMARRLGVLAGHSDVSSREAATPLAELMGQEGQQ